MNNISKITDCLCEIDSSTQIVRKGRYIEPTIAKILNEKLVFVSREYEIRKVDHSRMIEAIEKAEHKFQLTDMIFVDGGGDSLVLEPEDANAGSETTDPFQGGDAEILAAIHQSNSKANIYQAVISVGLDINEERFQKNVERLKQKNCYFGRVNFRTGEKQDFKLEHLFEFKSGFMDKYFKLADDILILNEKQLNDSSRMMSHTATVTYHALKGEYGVFRTYVPWEPIQSDGSKGALVKPEHCWMYFFDARGVEQLKRELNNKSNL